MRIALRFEDDDLELQLTTTCQDTRRWPTDTMRQRVLACGGELTSEPHGSDGARGYPHVCREDSKGRVLA